MRYNYVLFDLDGTLTQPEEGITKSIQYALEKLGITEPNRKKLCKFIGPPLVAALREEYNLDAETGEKALMYYRERFLKVGMYENEVFDGIPELLSDLQAAGVKILMATSKPEPQALEILRHFGLLPYFDVTAGSTLDGRTIEKPHVMQEAMRRIPDFDKSKAVMVGDRKFDVLGAKSCQIPCIGVLYGHGSREELQQAGADVIVPTVAALKDYLFS